VIFYNNQEVRITTIFNDCAFYKCCYLYKNEECFSNVILENIIITFNVSFKQGIINIKPVAIWLYQELQRAGVKLCQGENLYQGYICSSAKDFMQTGIARQNRVLVSYCEIYAAKRKKGAWLGSVGVDG
jgi:hypothetical protein